MFSLVRPRSSFKEMSQEEFEYYNFTAEEIRTKLSARDCVKLYLSKVNRDENNKFTIKDNLTSDVLLALRTQIENKDCTRFKTCSNQTCGKVHKRDLKHECKNGHGEAWCSIFCDPPCKPVTVDFLAVDHLLELRSGSS